MADTDDIILINIFIRGEQFEVKVPRSEEANYRNAQSLVEDKLNLYGTKYESRGRNAHCNMTMLDLALEVIKLRKQVETDNSLIEGYTEEIKAVLSK